MCEIAPQITQSILQAGFGDIEPDRLESAAILRSDLADDPEVTDLLYKFLGNLGSLVDRINQHALANQMEQLASLSHQLKGAGGGYGYPSITDAARKVEFLAKANQDFEQIKLAVAELTGLCRRAIAGRTSQHEDVSSNMTVGQK